MTARDNVLPMSDPEVRDLLLSLVGSCQDLREATARMTEALLNALMSAQADEICGAPWGQRSEARSNSRNGYRERSLSTAAGDLTLRVPKLRHGSYFPEGVVGRWSRVDAALAAAVAEMYVNGVATRKVERVAEELGVHGMSKDRVSRIAERLDEQVEELRTRPLDASRHCYLWLDATWMRCRVDGASRSQALVTAIALDEQGRKELCGLDLVDTESHDDWRRFLRSLRARGLSGLQLVVSDACPGLRAAIEETFVGAAWQRCTVHLMRDVLGKLHKDDAKARATELMRASFGQSDPLVAHAVLRRAAEVIRADSAAAADCLAGAEADALAFMAFPEAHWPKIRTNNVQERANVEIKRRYRQVQCFPSRESLVRLVGAVMLEESEAWASKHVFRPESAQRAWQARPQAVPTELDLKAADRRAEAIVAGALDRAASKA